MQGNPDLELNRVIHGGTAFAAAVQNSHVDVVRYLAGLGADMETPIHDGATPAFIACYRGNVEIVRFLCSQMVNLETPNANGNTPFAIAAQHRRLDIAEILLQHGVNIAPVNKNDVTSGGGAFSTHTPPRIPPSVATVSAGSSSQATRGSAPGCTRRRWAPSA